MRIPSLLRMPLQNNSQHYHWPSWRYSRWTFNPTVCWCVWSCYIIPTGLSKLFHGFKATYKINGQSNTRRCFREVVVWHHQICQCVPGWRCLGDHLATILWYIIMCPPEKGWRHQAHCGWQQPSVPCCPGCSENGESRGCQCWNQHRLVFGVQQSCEATAMSHQKTLIRLDFVYVFNLVRRVAAL